MFRDDTVCVLCVCARVCAAPLLYKVEFGFKGLRLPPPGLFQGSFMLNAVRADVLQVVSVCV